MTVSKPSKYLSHGVKIETHMPIARGEPFCDGDGLSSKAAHVIHPRSRYTYLIRDWYLYILSIPWLSGAGEPRIFIHRSSQPDQGLLALTFLTMIRVIGVGVQVLSTRK